MDHAYRNRRRSGSAGRNMLRGAAVLLAVTAVAGCTVRPLYSTGPSSIGAAGGDQARLASITVSPATTRPGQEVRNHLVFLFGQGAGEPASPAYTMRLSVASTVIGAAVYQIGSVAQEPTSSLVNVTANYTVVDNATGKTLFSGSRMASAPFDYPRQQYAALRAQRDAENRAAREAAQLVYLAVGQSLARTP